MSDRGAHVESMGIGAAQEFLLAGRDLLRALAELQDDPDRAVGALDAVAGRVGDAADEFRETMRAVREDLPLPAHVRRSVRELPWAELTERGAAAGYLDGPADPTWRWVVAHVARGDPLAPVETVVAKLSAVRRHLRSAVRAHGEGRPAALCRALRRAVRAYLEAVAVGVRASYANLAVGRARGVGTVPER